MDPRHCAFTTLSVERMAALDTSSPWTESSPDSSTSEASPPLRVCRGEDWAVNKNPHATSSAGHQPPLGSLAHARSLTDTEDTRERQPCWEEEEGEGEGPSRNNREAKNKPPRQNRRNIKTMLGIPLVIEEDPEVGEVRGATAISQGS